MLSKQKFHMLLQDEITKRIKECPVLSGNTFSDKMVSLLYLVQPVIKKTLFREEEQYSRYRFVGKSKHKMIYMEQALYRFLKKVHQDLNYFSIAQIIRRACKLFLRFVDKWGPEKAIEKIRELAKKISKKKRKKIDRRLTRKELLGIPVFQVAYDAIFRPVTYHQLE